MPTGQIWKACLSACPSKSPVERLLPCKKRVVDLERAGTDPDGALHPPWRNSGIDIPEVPIHGPSCVVFHADRKSKSGESSRGRRSLGRAGQSRGDAAPAILRAHGNILELRRVGQGEVCMAQGLITLPCDQVVAIPLLESGETEHGPDPLDLVRRQLSNLQHGRSLTVAVATTQPDRTTATLITTAHNWLIMSAMSRVEECQ
jgi:hypothetical protein